MAIPYNDNLIWGIQNSNPDWHKIQPEAEELAPAIDEEDAEDNQAERALIELFLKTPEQLVIRSIQFVRDSLRLVLKVPLRAVWTPIILEKNWKELERAKINAKLTGYSFVQLASVPVKFLVALAALVTSAISWETANWLLDESDEWTATMDGRASQLEALKEQAGKNAPDRDAYDAYKNWLYSIDPKLCRE